jgi:hypothetical protein
LSGSQNIKCLERKGGVEMNKFDVCKQGRMLKYIYTNEGQADLNLEERRYVMIEREKVAWERENKKSMALSCR